MRIDIPALLTIGGMALVTYVTRVLGYFLIGRVTLSPRLEAGLRAIPGAVLISIVAPAVFAGGIAEALAALATVLVAARIRNLLAAMAAGVLVVWALHTLAQLP
jgi:uncharacterized membrane protein